MYKCRIKCAHVCKMPKLEQDEIARKLAKIEILLKQ